MADDEAKSESTSKRAAASSPLDTSESIANADVEVAADVDAAQFKDDSSGVRTIVIERSEYGFGFTLRHFIVYPPESSAILARDRRLGFRRPSSPNEPIDTIFVKNVRENGPAHVAGLATGDRIISVNGLDIGGLSYLRVVNLIFRTKGCLRLAVVAQENDALQLYFGQVAHHPESNRKPRQLLASEVESSRTPSMISSNMRHYARCDSSPLCSPLQPCNLTSTSHRQTQASPARRLEDVREIRNGGATDANCYGGNDAAAPSPSSSSTPLGLNGAYSVDVEFDRNNCDSMSDSSSKDYLACDDSVVMNRLRKSLEQKQEFLNRLPCWTAAADPLPSSAKSFASAATSPVASTTSLSPSPPPPPPPFQVVSARAKQFENGPPSNDRTELFRSELARLSVVKNAVNVATRKRDLEYRVQLDKQSVLGQVASRGPDANAAKQCTAARNEQAVVATRIRTGSSSGNQTIPVGSNKLHCEPPSEFHSVFQTKRQVDDKTTRRISYLKATTAYSMNVDSENEIDEAAEPAPVTPQRRTTKRWRRTPLFPGDIQRLRRFFEDLAATGVERGVLGSRKIAEEFPPDQEDLPVVKEGNVFCKVIQVEAKKASDRSWKPIWLILKGSVLYLVKEKKESLFVETPATFEKSDLAASCDRLDIRCSVVEVANDYTKRKHVLRLNAPSVGTELLLQAQDANSMGEWVRVLREQAQTAVPVTFVEPMSTNFGTSVSPSAACNKTLRKLASLRTRSPTGDAPTGGKCKKPTPNDYQQTSPKTKTWKNKMAKQFRKIQPGANSPVSSAAVTYPAGATIGVPLELCPSSTISEYVPSIVQVCTNIVEAKGLEIIGIYRVPGNTAAVTSLTEAVNRGLDMTALDQDPRWSDVNVISSLLKSFFRKLPDALLTSELYPSFIKSDAIEDPIQRLMTIRKLVHDLPDHNFETLKYLLLHLKRVVSNSAVNKMEARNLAIVFGPTLIRSGDDMFTMVTDMSHQCRIVESLLSHVDWCFGNGDVNELKTSIPETNSIPELEATSSNHTLLLGNIRKVEECMQSPTTAKDFVSTIIGAANRKMHKTSKHLIGSSSGGGGGGGGKKSVANVAAAAAVSAACSSYAISGGSDDVLDSVVAVVPSIPVVTKNTENKGGGAPVESRTDNIDAIENENLADGSRDVERDGNNAANQDQVLWTYPKLSAETKERIRKFEEETEALLQRCTNPRRHSGCASILEETEKEKTWSKHERMVHESPPPVVVTRRNLPNVNVGAKNFGPATAAENCWKKSPRIAESVRNNSREKSASLESLNRTGRPSSRLSDDGCDLLMTLTSTFDKKLKSLSNDTSLSEDAAGDEAVPKSQSIGRAQVDRNRSFRDPSLHRNMDKWCRMDATRRTDANITDKENDQHDEEKEKKDVDEKETRTRTQSPSRSNSLAALSTSCATCGCSVAHSEAIQQNCDNWKRSALQEIEIHSQQNRGAGVGVKRGEGKLFYSNSVKLRRSGSLKEDGASTKLRRSGSLNKYEPSTKVSKFECLMLTKNADAIKLRRGDSLTKSEKTETNLKRRQHAHPENNRKVRGSAVDKEGKLKRRNGVDKCRNIKRRHTVGGTKDFDKISWLHDYQQRGPSPGETDKENRRERRTSSPDLSAAKAAAAGASAPDFLVQVVVRPTSFIAATADPNFVSRLLNIPLESHV